MKFKKIFGVLLVFSTLASAIAGPKPICFDWRKRNERKEEEGSREVKEGGVQEDLKQRGIQSIAMDPTLRSSSARIFPDPEIGSSEADKLKIREGIIYKTIEKYSDEVALFYAHHALESLRKAGELSSITFDDIQNPEIKSDSQKQEIISISQQQAAVYNSIACDYMDAAQAKMVSCEKIPKPYLNAVESQERMIDFLNELKELNEAGVVDEEKKLAFQNLVQQAAIVTTKIRTQASFLNIVDERYSGPRFFPEMPH